MLQTLFEKGFFMKSKSFIGLIGVITFMAAPLLQASITVPGLEWFPATSYTQERNLVDILNSNYGPSNWVQIPDETAFFNPEGQATASVKYASYTQQIFYSGAHTGTTASPILQLGFGGADITGPVSLPSAQLLWGGETFTLLDAVTSGYTWSSDPLQNVDNQVHVVKFKITNAPNRYVFAFEDLYGAGGGDFQDMVVQVDNVSEAVPEPVSLIVWAVFGGLGVVYVWRKRKDAY
jgi:hypothetical protein